MAQTTPFSVCKEFCAGGGGASSAENVKYDNTTSGLAADNVGGAIDEICEKIEEIKETEEIKNEEIKKTTEIVNTAKGTDIYLTDSAETPLKELSIDAEYSKICVCGNNLLNPIAITCSHLIYSETELNMKRASTKNDSGMRINSINYDNSIGIIATQEDTKADNKTALSDLTGGYFFIYFDTPSPCYKFNEKYTFIADIEVTENKHPNQSMAMIIRGAATPNTDVTLTGTTSKICVTVTASQSEDNPHRRCIQVITRGKSIIMKNIMWLEGNHKSNPPDYEDYKGQEITNVDNYKSIHTYYPITRIINDTDANMSVKYVADTKTYIDNKFAALEAAILSQGGNV